MVTPEQLAAKYKELYPNEFIHPSGLPYDKADHERICNNWLNGLPGRFAMGKETWCGKMSRAFVAVLGLKFPRTKPKLLAIYDRCKTIEVVQRAFQTTI